jgi:hypothetical protein
MCSYGNYPERKIMAKIIKVASSTNTPRVACQFKTSRNTATNPFKYQNFEGNTLDVSAFADVFESSAARESSKMKIIAASVAGSMHKLVSGITEPIINFVNRIKDAITSGWEYAKNTNITEHGSLGGLTDGIDAVGEIMNKPISISAISDFMNKPIDLSGVGRLMNTPVDLSGVGKLMNTPVALPGAGLIDETLDGIKTHIGAMNENMLDLGKGIGAKWSALISKVNHAENKDYSTMSVSELEQLLKAEIAANYGEAA